ncbi:TPA: hypothetical protein EYM26_09575 [Candidatus Poribacteria bacterium]|nr:hypothetical protein [Candidatus Poribacteria bacterium]
MKTAGNHYLRRVATPIEIYRIQNQNRTVQRKSIIVGVVEIPKLMLEVVPNQISVSPEKSAKLKIIANRYSSRQNLTLSILGLSSGVRLERAFTVLDQSQSETEIEIFPNIVGSGVGNQRQNPFVGRELAVSPYNIVVNASVGNQLVASSPVTKLLITK